VKKSATFQTPANLGKAPKNLMTTVEGASPEFTVSPASITGGAEAPKVTYEQRQNAGQSVVTMNQALGMRGQFEPSDRQPLGMRCIVDDNDVDFENVKQRYRYMFTSLDERSRALDKQLIRMQEAMCEMASISPEDLQPVGIPSQETVWVCGRICCDSAEGRINKESVMIEGSRRDSGGRRVHLVLQEIPAYSLFPGQIVLVEGTNSSGRKMVAKRIIEGVPPQLPRSSPAQILEYHHSSAYQGGQPLSVMVAAGPFTTQDNLDYRPFEDILVKALKAKPDVLILVGPFVDASQPIVSSGDCVLVDRDAEGEAVGEHTASFEMVFVEKIVRDGFTQMFNSQEDFGVIPTNIILVPSLLDAHHECVFPQPPFGDRERVVSRFFEEPLGVLDIPFSKDNDIRKRIHLMPNPCMFRVNEVLFGVCSNDLLLGLSSDEVSLNPGGNRLHRLAAHVLQQRSFAPQFPVPSCCLAQMDMRQSRHWQMDVAPDVLITPSKLTPMAKDIFGTVVLNPGQLAKGSTGGSFAELSIHPIREEELRDARIAGKEEIPHNVPPRTFVNIQKI
jgi:DNA polymerase alpha subunit B